MAKKANKTHTQQILAYIKRYPSRGVTRRELTQKLGLLHQSVGPRVAELVNAGVVVDSGERRDGCRVLRIAKRS